MKSDRQKGLKIIEEVIGIRTFILLMATFIYFAVILGFDYFAHIETIIFSTTDAKGYLSVMHWITGNPDEKSDYFITMRPFLYPLILAGINFINLKYGLWIIQFAAWLLTVNILISCLTYLKLASKWVILAMLPFILCVTGIIITMHGLTESITTLLLAIYVWLVLKKHQVGKIDLWSYLILIASILTVIKPLFQYLLFFSLLFAIWDHARNKIIPELKSLAILIFSTSFILVQLSIMNTEVNEIRISRIDEFTIKHYFFKYTYARSNPELSEKELDFKLKEFSSEDVKDYIIEHPWQAMDTYFHNVFYKNLGSHSTLSRIPDKHGFLVNWSGLMNRIFFVLHLIFLFIILSAIYRFIVDNKWDLLITTLTLSCPLYLIFFTSGITLWQGDRVVVTAIPIWIVLYLFIIKERQRKLRA